MQFVSFCILEKNETKKKNEIRLRDLTFVSHSFSTQINHFCFGFFSIEISGSFVADVIIHTEAENHSVWIGWKLACGKRIRECTAPYSGKIVASPAR